MGANSRRAPREVFVHPDTDATAGIAAPLRAFSWADSETLPGKAVRPDGAADAPFHVLGFELLK